MFIVLQTPYDPKLRRSDIKRDRKLTWGLNKAFDMPLLWSLGICGVSYYKHHAPNGAFLNVAIPLKKERPPALSLSVSSVSSC